MVLELQVSEFLTRIKNIWPETLWSWIFLNINNFQFGLDLMRSPLGNIFLPHHSAGIIQRTVDVCLRWGYFPRKRNSLRIGFFDIPLYSLYVNELQGMLKLKVLINEFHDILLHDLSFRSSGYLNDEFPELHYLVLIFSDFTKTFILNSCLVLADFKNSEQGLISNRLVLFVFAFFLHKAHPFLYFPHATVESVFDSIVGSK